MMSKKKVIIVSELFFPEESATAHIMTQIANHISREYNVLVLAGPKSYENDDSRISNDSKNATCEIKRAWAPRLNKNYLFLRMARFFILSFGLAWLTLRNNRRDDIVLSVTNPAPFIIFLALIKKIKNVKFILLVHDIFPENSLALGIFKKNSFVYKWSKLLFDWAYSAADHVIVIGRDMANVVKSKLRANNENISIIENWADLDLVNPIQKSESKIKSWGLTNKIVIQYAGNIGRAQGIIEFIDVIKLVNNSLIHFTFFGSGAFAGALNEKSKHHSNISLFGGYSRIDQNIILGSCDIALIILAEGMYGLGVPSKTYNIMASGKPILFLGPKDSEIFRMIIDHKVGWAFDWSQTDQMILFMNSIKLEDFANHQRMGRNARVLAESSYSAGKQLARIQLVIESLLGKF
jgi:glycosyltransferase involved in cell wall biosynthesis